MLLLKAQLRDYGVWSRIDMFRMRREVDQIKANLPSMSRLNQSSFITRFRVNILKHNTGQKMLF